MSDFLRRFWQWTVSLAGIVGLYLGALAVQLVSYFWLVLGVAIVLAVATKWGRRVLDVADRVRKYPILLARAAALESERDDLVQNLSQLQSELDIVRRDSIIEGERRILGTIKAVTAGDPPVLVAAVRRGGVVVLVAKPPPAGNLPPISCRYALVDPVLEELVGAMEVYEVEPDRQLAFLKCVIPANVAFWQALDDRVDQDRSAPAGVELKHQAQGLGMSMDESDSPEAA